MGQKHKETARTVCVWCSGRSAAGEPERPESDRVWRRTGADLLPVLERMINTSNTAHPVNLTFDTPSSEFVTLPFRPNAIWYKFALTHRMFTSTRYNKCTLTLTLFSYLSSRECNSKTF